MNDSQERIINDGDREQQPPLLPNQAIEEDDTSTIESSSTIVDFPIQPSRPATSSAQAQQETVGFVASSTSLTRKDSTSSKPSNGKSFKSIRMVATRLKVANQLSIAKRTGRDAISISGGAMNDEPLSAVFGSRPDFGSKANLPPPSQNQKKLFAELFDSNAEQFNRGKEGIISGGDLIFDNDFKSNETETRPYIYVMPDVDAKNIAETMLMDWGITLPRIAVVMLSSVGELQTWHNPRQINAFKKGLMKAANTTSMWIVTNGLDCGVAKVIGDAIEKEQKERKTFRYYESNKANAHPTFVIGIANDHNLAYSQQFFGKSINLGSTIPNTAENRYELNQQHTHFVVLNSVNSSENGHNVLLINLIDYLTKNALNSPDPEDQGIPYFGSGTSFTNLPKPPSSTSERPGGDHAPADNDPSTAPSSTIPQNGSVYKEIPLEQMDVDDTIDYLTTPETSGAPAPETVSLISHQVSRQVSMSTLVPDTAGAAGSSKKPSFVQESKTSEIPAIVEQYHIPGADGDHNTDFAKSKSPTARSASLMQTSIIPVVCLVIQGGYECAKLVLDNLRRRNPVIVLRGSGGFADLLSYAYLEMQQRCRDLYQSWDAEFVEHTLKPLLTTKIVKRFPHLRNNALARNMFRDRIIECVRESGSPKGRIYLSVLNMHNSSCNLEMLSEYILLSLFKSQNRRDALDSNLIRKDLYLTIDWNCSHVALDEVLRRNPSYNLQLEKSIFEIALVREDREDFIDLFLSHGFKVHKYLTPFRLKRLIRYSLSESEFFRSVCMENILGIAVWSFNFEEMMEKLSLSTSECPDADSFISNEFNHLIFVCTSLRNFVQVEHLYMNIMGLYQVDVESTERKALTILAMWAVFNQRFKLAQILWKHSDQPIHMGLILSMMYHRMIWFVPEQNLKDELSINSKCFEQNAIGVLDVCYRQVEKRAFDLLSQENSDWDKKTAVDIAADGQHRAFIAHTCCQKWLSATFNGRIRLRELSWGVVTVSPVAKIILSAFLIFPMYIWIRFVDDQTANLKRPSLDDFQASDEGEEQSDNEEDRFLSDHMKMIELNRNKRGANQSENNETAKRPVTNDELRDTLSVLREQAGKDHLRDTFRQRRLFIRKQPPLWTMIYLMWNSPITKFWTYQVFYILYLALFSLAVIWPGCGNWYLDATVCLWTFLNLMEHMHRTYKLWYKYTSVPMVFKIFEIVALILLLLVYLFGRVFTINGHSFANLFDPYTMKVVLCLGLLYFYYRLFAIHLPISPTLGPLLYRFKIMVTQDFLHFMRMALILLISSGIVIQAILYPNTELSIDTFHKAFHRSAISLFLTPVDELLVKCNRTDYRMPPPNGAPLLSNETFIDAIKPNSTRKFVLSNIPDKCPAEPIPMADSCPRSGFWAYFFSFQFLIFLKLILMTLLYALFASTASKLQSDTDNIWKFQRYTLVIDFTNRPALHAPLSIFVHIYQFLLVLFRCFTCKCIKCGRRKKDHVDNKVLSIPEHDDEGARLSQEDYNYWRHLAKTYYDDEQKKKDKADCVNKQSETIQLVCEEIEHSKHVLRGLKTKITEMERIMFQSQIYLEDIKHNTISGPAAAAIISDLPLSTSGGIHFLSRHTPYVGTRIQRFPIADKYVSWDVIWINYDPVIYSRKREDFPASLKPYVDEDILSIKERLNSVMSDTSSQSSKIKNIHLPVFNWNAVSVNPAGYTYDRRSWLFNASNTNTQQADSRIIYKLDDGIPLNPFGRTGLRGKGNLPRWGPNHYVMLILTRSNTNPCGSTVLEFALELKLNVLSIPMRFVGDDKPFTELRQLIAKDDDKKEWSSEEDMFAYFQSRIDRTSTTSVKCVCSPSTSHYMDSPDNTDNAWKEVKVYHVHFACTGPNAVTDSLVRSGPASSSQNGSPVHAHSTLVWLISTEDLLVRLPMEQVSFMNAVLRRFQQKHCHPK